MKAHRFFRSWGDQIVRLQFQILLLCLMLISISAAANGSFGTSTLELQTWTGSRVELRIDGRLVESGVFLRVPNLSPGRHQMEVIQRRGNAYGQGGGGMKVLYRGTIRVPQNRLLRMRVERDRSLNLLESRPLRVQQAPGTCGTPAPVQWDNGCQTGNWNHHDQWNQPVNGTCNNCGMQACNSHGHQCGQTCACGQQEQWQHGYDPYPAQEYGWDYTTPAVVVMNHQDFQQLKRTLDDNFFDDQRLMIAKQAIGQQMLSTDQVIELLESFSFESTRLEFAKFAYTQTIDRQRYYLVNQSFHFSSSINELNAYIDSI